MAPQTHESFQCAAICYDNNNTVTVAIRYSIHAMSEMFPDISHCVISIIVWKFMQEFIRKNI